MQSRAPRRFTLISTLFLLALITANIHGVAHAGSAESNTAVDLKRNLQPQSGMVRVLVKISENANLFRVSSRLEKQGVVWSENAVSDELAKIGVIIIEVPAEEADARLAEILQTVSGIQSVEVDGAVFATDIIPNDPGYANQYALKKIRAPQGWAYSTGSPGVTIAIVDSGVDLNHPDLKKNIVAGYDFYNNDATPSDDYGHGTHAAGIAAAAGNNGKGISGVSWKSKIMPVKVLNSSGSGSFSGVATGIIYAADHGAQVINLSLGASTDSPTLYAAIQYAYNKGVLLVAASGNNGGNFVLYPAKYNEVIAVGATDSSNNTAIFSNYGGEVDLAAPGDLIYSTMPGGYGFLSGTSMAAPHVSGLAAILFGYVNNAAAVRSLMENSAKDIGPAGWDDYSGAGLIQMDAALQQVAPAPPTPTKTIRPTKQPAAPNGNQGQQTGGHGNSPSNGLIRSTSTFTPLPSPAPASPTPTWTATAAESVPADDNDEVNAAQPGTVQDETENHVYTNKSWIPLCSGVLFLLAGLFILFEINKKQ